MFFNGLPVKGVCPAGGQHAATAGRMHFGPYNAVSTAADHGAEWSWCEKCQSMWYSQNMKAGHHGVCPAGGQHVNSNSGNYLLTRHQSNWKWCNKCEILHYTRDSIGKCAAGGTHDVHGSGLYALHNAPAGAKMAAPPGQPDWAQCLHCHGLFYNGTADKGKCPHSAAGHEAAHESTYFCTYNVAAVPTDHQNNWKWCSKCQVMWYSGGADSHGRRGHCPAGGHHIDAGSGNYIVHVHV
jgi:hypothetical protein